MQYRETRRRDGFLYLRSDTPRKNKQRRSAAEAPTVRQYWTTRHPSDPTRAAPPLCPYISPGRSPGARISSARTDGRSRRCPRRPPRHQSRRSRLRGMSSIERHGPHACAARSARVLARMPAPRANLPWTQGPPAMAPQRRPPLTHPRTLKKEGEPIQTSKKNGRRQSRTIRPRRLPYKGLGRPHGRRRRRRLLPS